MFLHFFEEKKYYYFSNNRQVSHKQHLIIFYISIGLIYNLCITVINIKSQHPTVFLFHAFIQSTPNSFRMLR